MCFSARRASSCNMHRPSLNGCSAPSSCCFMGHLPLSSPAYREIPWRCWLEEGHWDLLGENTRWMHWEGPVHTRSHTHTNLKTCPYCSPLAHLDATHSACLFLSNSGCRMSLIIHFQPHLSEALTWTRPVQSSFTAEWIPLSSTPGVKICCHRGELHLYGAHTRAWYLKRTCLHFARCTSVKPNFFPNSVTSRGVFSDQENGPFHP